MYICAHRDTHIFNYLSRQVDKKQMRQNVNQKNK